MRVVSTGSIKEFIEEYPTKFDYPGNGPGYHSGHCSEANRMPIGN